MLVRVNFITTIIAGVILAVAAGTLAYHTSSSFVSHQQPAAVRAASLAPTSTTPLMDAIVVDQAAAAERADLLHNMSLEEKVGQLFMIGHWKENNFYHTTNLLRAYHFGGVIIMKTSVENAVFADVWTKFWQRDSVVLPPLVAIDQEGGVVSRLQGPYFDTTSQRELTTTEQAESLGKKRGFELADLGINMNLAPVIDFSSNTSSFMYQRSFADPDKAVMMANALMAGHKANNVISVLKHFPGHADTPDDSHEVLPIAPFSEVEFLDHINIFKQIITLSDPDVIMTAHVLFPNIDPSQPASLSETIMTDYLRGTLQFDGLIMTDDMTMGAITNQWSSSDAAVQAVKAGADIILFASEPNKSIAARNAVLDAVQNGEISEDRINQSLERIYKLKQHYLSVSSTP